MESDFSWFHSKKKSAMILYLDISWKFSIKYFFNSPLESFTSHTLYFLVIFCGKKIIFFLLHWTLSNLESLIKYEACAFLQERNKILSKVPLGFWFLITQVQFIIKYKFKICSLFIMRRGEFVHLLGSM